MPIINRVAEYHQDMTEWRRFLHAHPELAYEEVETAAFVAAKLREFGVDEIHEGIGRTGIVAVIHGREEGDGGIGLRCDMDALPIQEKTGAQYASTTPGKMHACGHDGHTTMLLGTARYLAETRNFKGKAYLIFQPAEEGHAGAMAMIKDELFERFPMQSVFGLHNWPMLPMGEFAMGTGPVMAAADQFDIELTGVGCHAAMPQIGRDPVTAGAQIVSAMQHLISRETNPLDSAVISITQFHGGDAYNVVPETAKLVGTVRTYKKETQDRIEKRMAEVVSGICAAFGVTGELNYRRGYPATVNHANEAKIGIEVASRIVGEDRVGDSPEPAMGAEDFAFMLEKKPGSYIFMGVGGAEDGKVLHSPYYDFNDEALPIGVSYFARLVETQLPAA